MKTVSGEPGSSGEATSRKKGWPLSRWLLLIALVLAAHIALIFTFGTRKPVKPLPVTNVPNLELATGSGAWLTLHDPTLFALPRREGFAGPAWLEPPPLRVHMVDWTEPPRLLDLTNPLLNEELGAVFSRFMQTNLFTVFRFDLKPPAQFTAPLAPLEPTFAKSSALHVEGGLAGRPLLTQINLPSWPSTDVIAPSRVQVLVNSAGEVLSAVLLPSGNPGGFHDPGADQRALELARAARFAPARGLTVGQMIFDWHTVAPVATNAPPIL